MKDALVLLGEIALERARQHEKGYDDAHDDEHGLIHLLREIHHRSKATQYAEAYSAGPGRIRAELVKLAALAVAGIEYIDRAEVKKISEDTQPLHIPPTELEDRRVYRLRSRNLTTGVYVEAKKGFIGIREKFGDLYLFMEYEWDTNPHTGTARAYEALESIPAEVELVEHFLIEDAEGRKRWENNAPLFEFLKAVEEDVPWPVEIPPEEYMPVDLDDETDMRL